MDLLQELRQNRMGRFQLTTLAVALTLIIIDGFDVAIMSYAAPSIAREWGIQPVQLGLLLSSGLFGMAAGSIFLTPMADRYGRRKVALISLAVSFAGLTLSIFAVGPTTLLVCRIITGIGVGGMMANLIVLSSEYSSDKRRGTVIAVIAAGYPIGAALGGVVARPLIPEFGWRSIFVAASVISAILLVISLKKLPESVEYLVAKRPRNALQSINTLLTKMKVPPICELPILRDISQAEKGAISEILTKPIRFRSLSLWAGYACLVAAYYFVNTWTPQLIASTSDDDSLGVTVALIVNIGGIVGALLFGVFTIKFRIPKALTGLLIASAATYLLFGIAFDSGSMGTYIAFFLGLTTTGAVAGYYAYSPGLYSARARATGTGWTVGAGRLMSIVAPVLVGFL
ncbi:MAG: MFS transporter, partial [Alcaligenaceae bacterium]